MSHRDDLLAKVDVLAFFAKEGVELRRLNDLEYQFKCPFHDDQTASANVNVNTGLWFCHAENEGGSLIDFLMKRHGGRYADAIARLEELAGGARTPVTSAPAPTPAASPRSAASAKPTRLTQANVEAWAGALPKNLELVDWLHDHRGFTDETIERWKLGWDGQRVTIPVWDSDGKLRNVRRYKRDAADGDKMLPLATGSEAATRLHPPIVGKFDELILVEGEWDMMLMQQNGFDNTLTVTSGAGIFKQDWVPDFAGKKVTIWFDNDDAGRKGATRVANMLAPVASVAIANVPGLPPKGDATDFFAGQGRDVDELRGYLLEAVPVVNAVLPKEEGTPMMVSLATASEAKHRGQRLRIPVLLSGKAMTPYTVPRSFNVHCDMSNKRYCPICPLAALVGDINVELSARDPKVLNLIAVSDAQQYTAMKALGTAVTQCNRPVITIKEATNIEELRVIPELDATNDAGESEYVSRTAYFIGHGLRANRSYEMVGYTHPLPKTQATVHLISEAIPAQDNISAFAMTKPLTEQLRIFGGPVDTQFRAIYEDFRANVHRIQGRLDMQIALDLVWHSAISFYFNGAFVRRGWTEAMVLGDSGQGKTEMALSLLGHYKLGERVQGEQASGAGLIGGLEKMNETWILGWGRIPLNDKRLLVIDETQGLQSGQIESMSDVRATGVAEITKIRTERTNARCRIIWLANPSTGRPLGQYNQGVLAIRDVFHKPEDIRRLDLVLAVATGDVSLADINARHGAPVEPRFTSELSRALILWAWSRRPDQIEFTPEATQAILDAATRMGGRYHASIPIVEPADQRLKLARLSVAAAARVFSADQTGEKIVVQPEHVTFVADFLERIYSQPSMAYDEYSGQMKSGESMSDDTRAAILTAMLGWDNGNDAVEFLRQAKIFRKTELEEVLGWTSEASKEAIKLLTGKRLIRSTRDGYIKTPAFIGLLRDTRDLPENRVNRAAEQVKAELGETPF